MRPSIRKPDNYDWYVAGYMDRALSLADPYLLSTNPLYALGYNEHLNGFASELSRAEFMEVWNLINDAGL